MLGIRTGRGHGMTMREEDRSATYLRIPELEPIGPDRRGRDRFKRTLMVLLMT